jgi:carbamoyl-phosphate synthase large subunit
VQGLAAAVQGIEAINRDEVGVRSLQEHAARLRGRLSEDMIRTGTKGSQPGRAGPAAPPATGTAPGGTAPMAGGALSARPADGERP